MAMRQVLIPPDIDPVGPALGGRVHALAGRTMGTTWAVKLVAGARPLDAGWTEGIQRELDTVVAQMSTWEAASDLGRFNAAPAGSIHCLPEEFSRVLSCALAVARDSGGAYDPTAGALVDLWGFGPAGRFDEPGFSPPSAAAVAVAASTGGWTRLPIETDTRSVRQPGGMRLDLSSIAKGFAVDQVVSHLQGRGVDSCLVEVGGELRGVGVKPDGQPWWVALESPDDGTEPATGLRETVVALHGLSVATSGDYRRFFEADGTRHAHTLDPRTGWPVANGLASVSVLHPDCMAADAWSTALTVMGVQHGLAEADRRGLAARFVVRRPRSSAQGPFFTEHLSRAFEALLA